MVYDILQAYNEFLLTPFVRLGYNSCMASKRPQVHTDRLFLRLPPDMRRWLKQCAIEERVAESVIVRRVLLAAMRLAAKAADVA